MQLQADRLAEQDQLKIQGSQRTPVGLTGMVLFNAFYNGQRRGDDFRRIEIAPGFHWSTTHVAGAAVPSTVFSVDWFVNPIRPIEFTGTVFTGKNLTKLGGLGDAQGFTIVNPRPGEIRVTPVRGSVGWAQVTWLATSRLSFNIFSGQHDSNNHDLVAATAPTVIHKNLAYGANFFYRLAPNVVNLIESSQVRSWYMGGQHPLNNHYDVNAGYLF